MKRFFMDLRQVFFPKGVWVAYQEDFTGLALFEDELAALRYASEHTMDVRFIRFGYDIRQEILRR
jgi:hypothetical protein